MGTKRDPTPPPQAAPPPPVQESPFEKYWNTRNLNLLQKLDSGKDVKDISELNDHLNLFNSAQRDDPSLAGEGLLSTNELSGGNSAQLGAIAQQLKSRRKQQAEGDLYNGVMDARHSAEAGGQWGAGMYNNREMGNANMQNQRYTAWLQRPKQPSFWQQLLLGGLQAGAQIGAAAI